MVSDGWSASFMSVLMNFLASSAACGLQEKGDKYDLRVPFKLDLLGPLGHVTGAGCGNEARARREQGDNGDIYERGDAVLIKHNAHAGMFNLIVHHTGEAWVVCSM